MTAAVPISNDAQNNPTEQDGAHSRLRWARYQWQLRTGRYSQDASDAALAIGMKPNTYRAYEREPTSSKHIPLDRVKAVEFARRFGVNWRWLLLNQGTPFEDVPPTPQARVIDAMAQVCEADQSAVAEMIEAFVRSRKASSPSQSAR